MKAITSQSASSETNMLQSAHEMSSLTDEKFEMCRRHSLGHKRSVSASARSFVSCTTSQK
jgi:hypothetical protein